MLSWAVGRCMRGGDANDGGLTVSSSSPPRPAPHEPGVGSDAHVVDGLWTTVYGWRDRPHATQRPDCGEVKGTCAISSSFRQAMNALLGPLACHSIMVLYSTYVLRATTECCRGSVDRRSDARPQCGRWL